MSTHGLLANTEVNFFIANHLNPKAESVEGYLVGLFGSASLNGWEHKRRLNDYKKELREEYLAKAARLETEADAA